MEACDILNEYSLLMEYGLLAARIHFLIGEIDRSLRDPTLSFPW